MTNEYKIKILREWFLANYDEEVWEKFKYRLSINKGYECSSLDNLSTNRDMEMFIYSAFNWEKTIEKSKYWMAIHNKWSMYVKENKTKGRFK